MARDKQTGADFNADWTKLLKVGGPPLLMEPVQATIRLAGSQPTRVSVLDGYGVPTGQTVPLAPQGEFSIDGRCKAYYYQVQR